MEIKEPCGGTVNRAGKFRSSKVVLIFLIILILLPGTRILSDGIWLGEKEVPAEGAKTVTRRNFKGVKELNYLKHWSLNYLPQGYEIVNREAHGNFVIVNILGKQGGEILFYYQLGDWLADVSINNQIHKVDKCRIMNTEAYSIKAIVGEANNGLAWNIYGYTFELWAKLSIDELKIIAESLC